MPSIESLKEWVRKRNSTSGSALWTKPGDDKKEEHAGLRSVGKTIAGKNSSSGSSTVNRLVGSAWSSYMKSRDTMEKIEKVKKIVEGLDDDVFIVKVGKGILSGIQNHPYLAAATLVGTIAISGTVGYYLYSKKQKKVNSQQFRELIEAADLPKNSKIIT